MILKMDSSAMKSSLHVHCLAVTQPWLVLFLRVSVGAGRSVELTCAPHSSPPGTPRLAFSENNKATRHQVVLYLSINGKLLLSWHLFFSQDAF